LNWVQLLVDGVLKNWRSAAAALPDFKADETITGPLCSSAIAAIR
jgi:hypothetical protein